MRVRLLDVPGAMYLLIVLIIVALWVRSTGEGVLEDLVGEDREESDGAEELEKE